MSKISNLIFKNAKHKVTSNFGKRSVIKTSAGNTSSFHRGTDYGTYGVKLPQYAIEEGTIYSCGKSSSDNALFVIVKYPRINKRFVHWHLDSVKVKKGQKVSKGTLLGYTGKTGKATGIHLHLGIIDLKTNDYIDPEKYSKEYNEEVKQTNSFLPTRGYFKLGDRHQNIGKIADFMYKTFPAYTSKLALGNYYGKNIQASVKEFQKRTGLDVSGNFGQLTLKELKKYGFKG